VAESCDGSSNDCPADAFKDATVVCRASAGVCDVAENCTGTGPSCPTDVFKGPETVCRPAAGECDLAESCTGSAAACPADAKSTAVCRAAAGDCDVAESCDGSSDFCPANAFKVAGSACGDPSSGQCDNADTCDGSGTCLPNHVANGTACDDLNLCTANDACQEGKCTSVTPAMCRVTGGGQLSSSKADRVSFGFHAMTDNPFKGQLEYLNHATGATYHTLSVDSLVITPITCTTTGAAGERATFTGTVQRNDGMTFDYVLVVEDCGEPGRGNDTFSISIGPGGIIESRTGTLSRGNVQVH
jgi:hypothetical protein